MNMPERRLTKRSTSHLARTVFVAVILIVVFLFGLGFVSVRTNSAAAQAKSTAQRSEKLAVTVEQQCQATRKFYLKERELWTGVLTTVQGSSRALPPDVVAAINAKLDEVFVLPNCNHSQKENPK